MLSINERLENCNKGISKNLKDIKWKALAESPFRFLRGTAQIFAEDFLSLYNHKSKIKTWISGDLHSENFGSYKGANRLVYFDLNDFDESVLAFPEPEITRFITSIIIAAESIKLKNTDVEKIIHEITTTYIKTVCDRKALMMEYEVSKGIFKEYFERVNARDRQEFIKSRTTKTKQQLTLNTDGKRYLPLSTEEKNNIFSHLNNLNTNDTNFKHVSFVDAIFRIAGTGSLGLERYCVLCFNTKKEKYYLLDIKESKKSCFSGLIETKQPTFKNEADRVISITNLMQFNAPAFLTQININHKWFIIKELQPISDKITLTEFVNDKDTFLDVIKEMTVLLAYSQLRSSGHYGATCADELIETLQATNWNKDIIEISKILAKKNSIYFKEFKKQVS